ncbi:MAG: hypothetical protein N3A69_04180 [Leptospiraceae bacterium]|nr:hypothetical protein [Leptospiraceae bacterium]
MKCKSCNEEKAKLYQFDMCKECLQERFRYLRKVFSKHYYIGEKLVPTHTNKQSHKFISQRAL